MQRTPAPSIGPAPTTPHAPLAPAAEQRRRAAWLASPSRAPHPSPRCHVHPAWFESRPPSRLQEAVPRPPVVPAPVAGPWGHRCTMRCSQPTAASSAGRPSPHGRGPLLSLIRHDGTNVRLLGSPGFDQIMRIYVCWLLQLDRTYD